MPELTEQQQRAYDWIVDYIQQNGVAPSLRDIMRGLHYASPCPVQSIVERLKDKGYITWIPGRARTLRLTATTAEPIAPPGYRWVLVPIDEQEAA